MKILYVEDEKNLALAIEKILRKNNYSVDVIYDGEEGLDYALSNIYDVIILDIMLPKLDGISLMRELRREGIQTPVILLTAKGETGDKILGLDSGADDYLAKPFQTGELLARLRALTRRAERPLCGNILRFEDIELNPNSLDLYCGQNSFRLTLKESQLMEMFIKNPGITISSSAVIEKLWGFDSDKEDSHVQVYVAFLRKKLNQLPTNVKIQTVRGAGYLLKVDKGGTGYV